MPSTSPIVTCSGGFKIFDKPELDVLQVNYVQFVNMMKLKKCMSVLFLNMMTLKNVCVYCVHIYRRKRCYITLLACV